MASATASHSASDRRPEADGDAVRRGAAALDAGVDAPGAGVEPGDLPAAGVGAAAGESPACPPAAPGRPASARPTRSAPNRPRCVCALIPSAGRRGRGWSQSSQADHSDRRGRAAHGVSDLHVAPGAGRSSSRSSAVLISVIQASLVPTMAWARRHLALDQLVELLLERAGADELVHLHVARLADAEGAVGGLVLHGRVPPAVEVEDVVGARQVEAGAAGLDGEDEQARRVAVVALEAVHQAVARGRRGARRGGRAPPRRTAPARCALQQPAHLGVLGEDQGAVVRRPAPPRASPPAGPASRSRPASALPSCRNSAGWLQTCLSWSASPGPGPGAAMPSAVLDLAAASRARPPRRAWPARG